MAFTLRLLGGETVLKLPAVIKYPLYDYDTKTQNFPFKTLTMLIALLVEIGVSGELLTKTPQLPFHWPQFRIWSYIIFDYTVVLGPFPADLKESNS